MSTSKQVKKAVTKAKNVALVVVFLAAGSYMAYLSDYKSVLSEDAANSLKNATDTVLEEQFGIEGQDKVKVAPKAQFSVNNSKRNESRKDF